MQDRHAGVPLQLGPDLGDAADIAGGDELWRGRFDMPDLAVTKPAGELRLQADLGGGRVLSSERSVSFAPGAPDPHACSVEPVRQGRAAADGEPLPLVVFVRDSQGNAVPGVRVQLLCAATGVTLHQPRLPSDPEGKVQAAVSATLAQRAEVEVKLLGLGQALPAPLSLEFTAPERAGP